MARVGLGLAESLHSLTPFPDLMTDPTWTLCGAELCYVGFQLFIARQREETLKPKVGLEIVNASRAT